MRAGRQIQQSCKMCGNIFLVWPYEQRQGRRFCSIACARKSWGAVVKAQGMAKPIGSICPQCGAYFKYKTYYRGDRVYYVARTQKYCSKLCHHRSKVGRRQQKRCDYCGEEIATYRSLKSSRTYCSRKCYGLGRRGIKHFAYKGAIYTCETCGAAYCDSPSNKNGKHNFCSMGCYRIAQRSGVYREEQVRSVENFTRYFSRPENVERHRLVHIEAYKKERVVKNYFRGRYRMYTGGSEMPDDLLQSRIELFNIERRYRNGQGHPVAADS